MALRGSLLILTLIGIALPGCSSTGSSRGDCPPGAKCPAPAAPKTTFVISIGDKHAALAPGGQANVDVTRGRPTPVTLAIRRPSGVAIATVWLVVSPTGSVISGPNGLRGKFTPVLHHSGALGPGQVLATAWKPSAFDGSRRLVMTVSARVGHTHTSWPIAKVHVVG